MSAGVMEQDPNHVRIFDTTLRDGEQSPGISLDPAEKVEIAEQLARLGVDYIEAGFPISNQDDFEATRAVAEAVDGPVIVGLSRTGFKDIDRAWEAVEPAKDKGGARIHVFIATSDVHMEKKLRMSRAQVIQQAAEAASHARQYTDDVEFSPEDASRSGVDFMVDVLQAAVDNGATTLNIPDTVGYGMIWDYEKMIRSVGERVRGDYVISTHCHNDLGLAVANSLAAVRAGARQIEGAINGIGERAGNAALEEVVMALAVRSKAKGDIFEGLYTRINTDQLKTTSDLVSSRTGYPVQYNKAVVGRNAFAHEAGIHQHGVLSDRETYEIMDAKTVGQSSELVLGKHSGRHAIEESLKGMGIVMHGSDFTDLFTNFKNWTTQTGRTATSVEIESLAEGIPAEALERPYGLSTIEIYDADSQSQATVEVVEGTTVLPGHYSGDKGPIDAAMSAVSNALGINFDLVDFKVNAMGQGSDAVAEVIVEVQDNGHKVVAKSSDVDTVRASALAYIEAANVLYRARLRSRETVRRS